LRWRAASSAGELISIPEEGELLRRELAHPDALLPEKPREAEVVVGTSAGSVVGALLRAGMSAEDQAVDVVYEVVKAAVLWRLNLT
jgi:hypothetical protein